LSGDDRATLDAIHARIDEVERAIAERDAVIAARVRSLAESPTADPMERHRMRVRELEATLALVRRERDDLRAAQPPQSAASWVAIALFLILAFSFVQVMMSAR
jgi:hypothetical protein